MNSLKTSAAMSTQSLTCPIDPARVRLARVLARGSLGLVWIYEGLVPKILFPGAHPEQTALVANSLFCFATPSVTLALLGSAQIVLGLLLLSGWRDREVGAVATVWMVLLIVLVAGGRPQMLTDPFGALAKDLCLIACAAVLWVLPREERPR
jgi:uncharacterized membrane protein YphA (DoxX/SURF4 family)